MLAFPKTLHKIGVKKKHIFPGWLSILFHCRPPVSLPWTFWCLSYPQYLQLRPQDHEHFQHHQRGQGHGHDHVGTGLQDNPQGNAHRGHWVCYRLLQNA